MHRHLVDGYGTQNVQTKCYKKRINGMNESFGSFHFSLFSFSVDKVIFLKVVMLITACTVYVCSVFVHRTLSIEMLKWVFLNLAQLLKNLNVLFFCDNSLMQKAFQMHIKSCMLHIPVMLRSLVAKCSLCVCVYSAAGGNIFTT